MRKTLYILASLIVVLSASSCSKCVQCTAKDKYNNVINVSNKICEPDFSRGKFVDRYNDQFKGYSPMCVEVSQ